MTKREEIRQGIRYFVDGGCAYYGEKECPFENNLACLECNERIDELLSYLHSQGVAIIDRDRELPECPYIKSRYPERKAWSWSRNTLLDDGFVATIPLIEETKEKH